MKTLRGSRKAAFPGGPSRHLDADREGLRVDELLELEQRVHEAGMLEHPDGDIRRAQWKRLATLFKLAEAEAKLRGQRLQLGQSRRLPC